MLPYLRDKKLLKSQLKRGKLYLNKAVTVRVSAIKTDLLEINLKSSEMSYSSIVTIRIGRSVSEGGVGLSY